MNYKISFRRGIRDGIPIGLGYFAVSFAFGMMAVSGGLHTGEAVLISLTNLTSAGQFAGLDIIRTGGTLMEMALTQLIINLRYLLMSFSLSQKLDRKEPFAFRYIVAFGITDEIFAVSASQPGKVSAFYNIGAMMMAIPGWTLGTLAGAISGNLLPSYILSALSVAIYGMFLAVIIPPAKQNRNVCIAVAASMLMSTVFYVAPVLKDISSGFTIIIITLVVAGLAAWLAPVPSGSPDKREGECDNA
ncbi:MAG: AzlC family ABC transporter permease [Eubacterium sp.]|nr:AzlC family ABC transporter permease [Eubacterium sp.]